MKKNAVCSYCDKVFSQETYSGKSYIVECLKHEIKESKIEEILVREIKSYLKKMEHTYNLELKLAPIGGNLIETNYLSFGFDVDTLDDIEIVDVLFYIDKNINSRTREKIAIRFKMLAEDLDYPPTEKVKHCISKKLQQDLK